MSQPSTVGTGSHVVVSCVAESAAHWVLMVENLAVTQRNFGGNLAAAPLHAFFIGSDPVASPVLDDLGVRVTMAARYPGIAAPTNKLRMFQAFADAPAANLLLALDCDVVVVGDLSADLPPDEVAMMPAFRSPLSPPEWADLLQRADLPVGQRSTLMQGDRSEVPAPYFNSGVMSVPAPVCGPLIEAWRHYIDLMGTWPRGSEPPQWAADWVWHVDQLALSCALLATDTQVLPLDPTLNLTTGLSWRAVEERFRTDPPRLLHYHERLTEDGQLLPTDSAVLNEVITRTNHLLAARTGRGTTGRPLRARLRAAAGRPVSRDLRQVGTPAR